MAKTPNRPVRLRLVFGKAASKGRRDSENPTRFLVEQITLSFAENAWDNIRTQLADKIRSDVRAELVAAAAAFRRNVIGAPGQQRGLVGTLKTRAVGGPTESLGRLPRWAPRGARYLEEKKVFTGSQDWFDNTGWEEGGALKEFFSSDVDITPGGATINIGSGGVFEELFGGVSVQILRNNIGSGGPQVRVGPQGKTAQVQVAKIRVRALGSLTDRMLAISDTPNTALLDLVSKTDPIVALHLRGGRGRYRPALEPYLKFFLEQALPHAVATRIRKGSTDGSLLKNSMRG